MKMHNLSSVGVGQPVYLVQTTENKFMLNADGGAIDLIKLLQWVQKDAPGLLTIAKAGGF